MYAKKSILIAALAFVLVPCSYASAQVPESAQKKFQEAAPVEDFGDDSLAYDEAKSHEESKMLTEAAPAEPASDYVADEPYTISDVYIDLKSIPVSKARDQALMQAQRLAYRSLCQRFAVQDNSDKLSDDDIANIVRSFEMQKEQISAARYIGVFKISFKEEAAKKHLFDSKNVFSESASKSGFQAPEPLNKPEEAVLYTPDYMKHENNVPQHTSMFTIKADVAAASSEAWGKIRSKISSIPAVTDIKMEGLGNGIVKINLSFNTSIQNLAQMLSDRNLLLRQVSYDVYEIYEMG
ncbi:MAG: hypothetical protein FWF23_00285 [Alphaproteobacteria bacterium]|nr:hypothetical protein [Alphaproteobacteria bacterium]MCL2504964.1 hypothetical protein [Alphaproteobacteria bacterium]